MPSKPSPNRTNLSSALGARTTTPGVKRARSNTPNNTRSNTRSNTRNNTPNNTRNNAPARKRARLPGVYRGRAPPDYRKLRLAALQRMYALSEQLARSPPGPSRDALQSAIAVLNSQVRGYAELERRVSPESWQRARLTSAALKRGTNRADRQQLRREYEHFRDELVGRLQSGANARVGPVIPDVRTPAFQAWFKTLFSTRAGGIGPTLLRGMSAKPLTALAYEALSQEDGDPCAELEPGVSSLRAHQAVVYAMAHLRAEGKIGTAGLLVTHSTGAGKTLAGLAVLLSFWNRRDASGNPVPVLFLSTNDNRAENDIGKFAKLAMVMFPDFVDETVSPPSKPFARPSWASSAKYWLVPGIVEVVAKRIKGRLEAGIRALMLRSVRAAKNLTGAQRGRSIYTFQELGNDLQNGVVVLRRGEPCVFVVDEVQYLVSPPPTEIGQGKKYELVEKALAQDRDPASTWCVGMTATPGETPEEVRRILNAVLGRGRHINAGDSVATMQKKARGHVSYAYLLGDRRRFASVRLRVLCSYLEGADGRSYYYAPYYRHLNRVYSGHKQMPANAKEFLERIKREQLNQKAWSRAGPNPDKQGHQNAHLWQYNAARSGAFLRPLRTLSLYLKPDAVEMKHLLGSGKNGGGNGNDDDGNGRKWHEIIVARSAGKDAVMVNGLRDNNAGNNNNNANNNEDAAVSVAEFNRRASTRAMPLDLRQSARVARTTRYTRYLVSPKITQFLRFVYNDLPLSTNKLDTKRHGIHYVYTSDPTAALLVAQMLERVLGMPQLKAADQWDPALGPRFIMIDNVEKAAPLLKRFATAMKKIPDLKKLASSDANKHGEIIKVVIATKKSFKGVDLRHVRYLHLLEPMVNFRDFIQFVGRGPRNCSHAGHKDPFVEVLLYRLMHSPAKPCPPDAGAALADCFLWDHSYSRYFGKHKFSGIEDEVLWKASVDYELFKDNLNKSRDALRRMVANLDSKCGHVVYDHDPNAPARVAGDNSARLQGVSQLEKNARVRLEKHVKKQHEAGRPANYPLTGAKVRAADKEAWAALQRQLKQVRAQLGARPLNDDGPGTRLRELQAANLQGRQAALRKVLDDEKQAYRAYRARRKTLEQNIDDANNAKNKNKNLAQVLQTRRAELERLVGNSGARFDAWYKHNQGREQLKYLMSNFAVDAMDGIRDVRRDKLMARPKKRPASPPPDATGKRAKHDEARAMNNAIAKKEKALRQLGLPPTVAGLKEYEDIMKAVRASKPGPNAPALSANEKRAKEAAARQQFPLAALWDNFRRAKRAVEDRAKRARKAGVDFDEDAAIAKLLDAPAFAEVREAFTGRHAHERVRSRMSANLQRNRKAVADFRAAHRLATYKNK